VLWILGDLVGLPFLAAMLIHMMREDESEAARIDAELDAREAQQARETREADPDLARLEMAGPEMAGPEMAGPEMAGPEMAHPEMAHPEMAHTATAPRSPGEAPASAGPAEPADNQEPQGSQLWWETDPRFTGRFKPTS
jgi:hypothetical protein